MRVVMFGAPLPMTQPKQLQTLWGLWGVSCEESNKNSISPLLCSALWLSSAVKAAAQVVTLVLLGFQPPWTFPVTFWHWAKTQGLDLFFPFVPCFWFQGGVLLIDGWAIEPLENYSSAKGLHHLSLSILALGFVWRMPPGHAMARKSLCSSPTGRSVLQWANVVSVSMWSLFPLYPRSPLK